VAKGDKAAKSLSLSSPRTGFKVSNLLIDQWSLVQVGMFAVRKTTREFWTQSFDSCKLDPRTRVSFGEWCERIGHFLQGGESFVPETFNANSEAYQIYAMLTTWWHAMTPHGKKGVTAVAHANDRQFTVECATEMHLACYIPMKDLQNLRLCLECSWENPAHLDMEEPIALDNQSAISAEVMEAQGLVKNASSGLEWFQLKPPGMKGQKLLDHMFYQRQLSFKKKETHLYIPNSYLDIAIKPSNIEVLNYMTAPDLSKRAIMKECAGNGAMLNLTARKLNQTGYVHRHCGLVHTEVKVRKLKNALQLSQYMATITNGQCSESAQQRVEKQLE
jgi:hypothetical protein